MSDENSVSTISTDLLAQIRELIDSSRLRVAATVNSELTVLNWSIGGLLKQHLQIENRAAYGQQLRHCLQLVETYPDQEIVYTLCRQLNWSKIRTFMYIEDPAKRDFYTEMAQLESWSVRQLQERISSMLFERTAISKQPEKTILADLEKLKTGGQVSPDLAFRDPYVLDFLGLADSYSERDLESAILAQLQRFIVKLGSEFAFVAQQKRISIDNRDYYIDLLFFHRRLKSLVAIDLKLGEFKAEFKGQMELYLRYLEKYETIEGEQSPIGLILCTGKNEEHVELLRLSESNIRVAEYLTVLPSRELLQQKLHDSIKLAKQKLQLDVDADTSEHI
ncbi:MAG: YhcG family protein [Granulosicoccus sp.]